MPAHLHIKKLAPKFDLAKLVEDLNSLRLEVPFHPLSNQICLNHRPGVKNPFYDGNGSLKSNNDFISESEFNIFNTAMRGTYLQFVYNSVWDFLKISPGRTRLMRLGAKNCLSAHKDVGFRFHIALVTNAQSFMVFENSPFFHIPSDSHLYWTNTVEFHSAINGHHEAERIHLVFAEDASSKMPEPDRARFLNDLFIA